MGSDRGLPRYLAPDNGPADSDRPPAHRDSGRDKSCCRNTGAGGAPHRRHFSNNVPTDLSLNLQRRDNAQDNIRCRTVRSVYALRLHRIGRSATRGWCAPMLHRDACLDNNDHPKVRWRELAFRTTATEPSQQFEFLESRRRSSRALRRWHAASRSLIAKELSAARTRSGAALEEHAGFPQAPARRVA